MLPRYFVGSSPLARGLRDSQGREHAFIRIIPARAGFTRRPPDLGARGADHPRSRGVYHIRTRHPPPQLRIIPARAGFTNSCRPQSDRPPDHPRSRGVYKGRGKPMMPGTGSSPLARGLQSRSAILLLSRRIIPARAGFTSCPRRQPVCMWDHPRSRGVYSGAVWDTTGGRGSSPLARGLRRHNQIQTNASRIIPARAGFTGLRVRLSQPIADHPRSRGVYAQTGTSVTLPPGSSPLARGLPIVKFFPYVRRRIIPARAGFTPLCY